MPPSAPPPTILVVEDKPALLACCANVLEEAGFVVLRAAGSSEALKVCTEHEGPIDLLLTDLVLPPPAFQLVSSSNQFPHVHGHVLAARAVAMRPGLRVALMSGNPDQELDSHRINRGTWPFIEKPIDGAALVTFVREVVVGPLPTIGPSASARGTGDVDWFG